MADFIKDLYGEFDTLLAQAQNGGSGPSTTIRTPRPIFGQCPEDETMACCDYVKNWESKTKTVYVDCDWLYTRRQPCHFKMCCKTDRHGNPDQDCGHRLREVPVDSPVYRYLDEMRKTQPLNVPDGVWEGVPVLP